MASDGSLGLAEHALWLTLETVVPLLTTSQNTTLLLEVLKADGWKSASGVVLSRVVVNLVNRNSGVSDVRLDGLLVDNWLDGLVDVVVNVLASKGWGGGASLLGLTSDGLITELGCLEAKTLLNFGITAMLKLALLNRGKVVVVLLSKTLLVVDWLDGGVVVVLVDLLVNSSLDLLVLVDVLSVTSDGWGNLLVNCSVVVARLGP